MREDRRIELLSAEREGPHDELAPPILYQTQQDFLAFFDNFTRREIEYHSHDPVTQSTKNEFIQIVTKAKIYYIFLLKEFTHEQKTIHVNDITRIGNLLGPKDEESFFKKVKHITTREQLYELFKQIKEDVIPTLLRFHEIALSS